MAGCPPPRHSCIQAREGDYLSSIARRAGIPTAALILDNSAAIADLDAPLAGKTLALCSAAAAAPGGARGGGAAGGGSDAGGPLERQLRALLDLKRAVDRNGILKNWTAESGRGGGYCDWQESTDPGPASYPAGPEKAPYILAVYCDKDKNVQQIGLRGAPLGGTLPGASVLARLPGLTHLVLGNASLSGALPDGGGSAGGSTTGRLPAAWGNLRGLEHFTLS